MIVGPKLHKSWNILWFFDLLLSSDWIELCVNVEWSSRWLRLMVNGLIIGFYKFHLSGLAFRFVLLPGTIDLYQQHTHTYGNNLTDNYTVLGQQQRHQQTSLHSSSQHSVIKVEEPLPARIFTIYHPVSKLPSVPDLHPLPLHFYSAGAYRTDRCTICGRIWNGVSLGVFQL